MNLIPKLTHGLLNISRTASAWALATALGCGGQTEAAPPALQTPVVTIPSVPAANSGVDPSAYRHTVCPLDQYLTALEVYDADRNGFDVREFHLLEYRAKTLFKQHPIFGERVMKAAEQASPFGADLPHNFFRRLAKKSCYQNALWGVSFRSDQLTAPQTLKTNLALNSVWNSEKFQADLLEVALFTKVSGAEYNPLPLERQFHLHATKTDPKVGFIWGIVHFVMPRNLFRNFTLKVQYHYREQRVPPLLFEFKYKGWDARISRHVWKTDMMAK